VAKAIFHKRSLRLVHYCWSIERILFEVFVWTVSSVFNTREVLKIRIRLKNLDWIIPHKRTVRGLDLNNRIIWPALGVIFRRCRLWEIGYVPLLNRHAHFCYWLWPLWLKVIRWKSLGWFVSLWDIRSLKLR